MHRWIGAFGIALAAGCVIDAEHVSTELVAVCTEDVPLLFEVESPETAVATVQVEDVGATIDDPDARATLDTVVLTPANGVADFAFVDAMQVDLLAPGSALPTVTIAEVTAIDARAALTAPGDSSIDLVDYLTSEVLLVRVELAGRAPASGFAAVLDACLDVDGIEIEE
jgi:hypothetical protein